MHANFGWGGQKAYLVITRLSRSNQPSNTQDVYKRQAEKPHAVPVEQALEELQSVLEEIDIPAEDGAVTRSGGIRLSLIHIYRGAPCAAPDVPIHAGIADRKPRR